MEYRHHIIPRHEWKKRFGNLIGFNKSDNWVILTLEQHIQVHKLLYELNGIEYDRIAFMVLSGLIGNEEAARKASSFANIGNKNSLGVKRTPLQNLENSNRQKGKAHNRGYKFTKVQSLEQSIRMLGNKNGKGSKRTKEQSLAQSIRQDGIPQSKVSCLYCKKTGGILAMKRYHFGKCKERK